MGKRYVVLEPNQASVIQSKYSCGRCWTPVRICHDKNGDYIQCGDSDCRCEGLIRTTSVQYMIEKSELRAKEAREVLQVHFEWLRKPKRERLSIEQNLSQLGF